MSPARLMYPALVIVFCSLPRVLVAQSGPNREAAQHFNRGLSLAKQKAYPEAIAEFNRAYQVSPHFSVMYNLGQAYLAIDQPVYAAEALRRYLAEGKDQIPSERRQQVETTITAQEQRIATLTVRSDMAGALVRIDGNDIGRTPLPGPIRLVAGQHLLDASLPGYRTWEHSLSLAGREQKNVDIRFEPTPAPAAAAPPATTPAAIVPRPMVQPSPVSQPNVAPVAGATAPGPHPAQEARPVAPAVAAPQPTPADRSGSTVVDASAPPTNRARRIAGYLVGSAGIGSLVVGSVFGLRAFSKKSDSDKECPAEQCSADGVRLNGEAKTSATVSTITFGVGLAAVGVAAYLLLSGSDSARAPSSGTVAHGILIAPEIDRGRAGVALRGVW